MRKYKLISRHKDQWQSWRRKSCCQLWSRWKQQEGQGQVSILFVSLMSVARWEDKKLDSSEAQWSIFLKRLPQLIDSQSSLSKIGVKGSVVLNALLNKTWSPSINTLTASQQEVEQIFVQVSILQSKQSKKENNQIK